MKINHLNIQWYLKNETLLLLIKWTYCLILALILMQSEKRAIVIHPMVKLSEVSCRPNADLEEWFLVKDSNCDKR
ncbi:MAG: hypothetical protein H6Q74_2921 [Firmicutes bacterium]|nr:hypothetical protein [Bacillota bacterium]